MGISCILQEIFVIIGKENFMEKFGTRLKNLTKEMGLSQEKLASEFHVDKSTIAKYETGKISPSIEMAVILAKYFSVSTDYLLGLEE